MTRCLGRSQARRCRGAGGAERKLDHEYESVEGEEQNYLHSVRAYRASSRSRTAVEVKGQPFKKTFHRPMTRTS